jgi:hypothetical protein
VCRWTSQGSIRPTSSLSEGRDGHGGHAVPCFYMAMRGAARPLPSPARREPGSRRGEDGGPVDQGGGEERRGRQP